MEKLNNLNLLEVLELKVIKQKIPILGICLGMQLMTSRSDEGDCKGLSWIDAETLKFDLKKVNNEKLRVPKIGWNEIQISRPSPLLAEFRLQILFILFIHIILSVMIIQIFYLQQDISINMCRLLTKIIFLEYSFIQKKAIVLD